MRSCRYSDRKYLALWLCALAALMLLGNTSVRAGGNSASKVKVSASAGPIDAAGKQMVTVTLVIEKTWHIYANPVKLEILESGKTVITVKSKVKLAGLQIQYPAGSPHQDKNIPNTTYRVYEGTVRIPVAVQRAAGDTSPLTISATFGACDDGHCLFPSTVKVIAK